MPYFLSDFMKHNAGVGLVMAVTKKILFEDLPLINREQCSAAQKAIETFISENRFPVRKKIELTSNEAVNKAVISGLGYSIMPFIGIKNEVKNKDLQIIPVKGLPIRTTWHLI